jgi:ketosteroid isomerase-like protein
VAAVEADIQAFFDSYRAAFERRDAKAIADHFRFPLHVTGDAGEVSAVAIPAVEAWVPQLERLLAGYAQLGVHTARMLETRTTRFSPRLAQAAVQWALETSAGKPIYQFDATYTLAKTGETYKITTIVHNEQLRAKEMLLVRASRTA